MTKVRGHICIRRQAKDGATGEAGKSIRTTVWETSKQYYAGDTQVDGVYPLDIVSDKTMAIGTSGVNFYMCIRSHTSSSNIPLTNTSYWQKLNSLKPVVTYLILAEAIKANLIDVADLAADNAFINNLIAKKLKVVNGNTVLLYSGDTTYPLMCGSDSPATAVTKVNAAGKLFASEADITGKITATEGQIGEWVIGQDPQLQADALVIGEDYDDGSNWTWIQQDKFAINNENGGVRYSSTITPGSIRLFNNHGDSYEINLSNGKITATHGIESDEHVKVGTHLYRSIDILNSSSNNSFSLTSSDEVILKSHSGNTAYLTLPTAPIEGQKYVITNAARATYIVLRSSNKSFLPAESSATAGSSGGYNTLTYSSTPPVITVIFDGTVWVTHL